MPEPVNSTQREFENLCRLGGGRRGGPAVSKVLDLLRSSGQRLNAWAYEAISEQLETFPEANTWHVCFAISLSWGHLAKLDIEFTRHAVALMSDWNDDNLKAARSFHLERGPEPLEASLMGGYSLFNKVRLPLPLPTTLERLWMAQERWLSPILNPAERPRYIGSWNATAMFMAALFSQPELAKMQRTPKPVLPPGGPVYNGLKMLYDTSVLVRRPAGTELDDEAFEPGALYENNQLLVELLNGRKDWCLLDAHSGVYMLGTRDPRSDNWC